MTILKQLFQVLYKIENYFKMYNNYFSTMQIFFLHIFQYRKAKCPCDFLINDFFKIQFCKISLPAKIYFHFKFMFHQCLDGIINFR